MTARIDRAARVVRAEPSRVFAALTDRQALESWLPPAGMSGVVEHFDLRPGGSYRMTLSYDGPRATGKTTADADVVDVRFVEIEPDVRIVQAVDFLSDDPEFAGTMTMTWTVEPAAGGGARVEVRAEDVPPGIDAADHELGMGESLDQLAAYVEAPPR